MWIKMNTRISKQNLNIKNKFTIVALVKTFVVFFSLYLTFAYHHKPDVIYFTARLRHLIIFAPLLSFFPQSSMLIL